MTNPTDPKTVQQAPSSVDQAVAEGGAYEVLRKRLSALGVRVAGVADGLNARRLTEFGESRLVLLGRLRIRTENNSVGRDIVQVGSGRVGDGLPDSLLLFGFNVFMGLKTQTSLEDVFGLYRLVEVEGGYDVEPLSFAGTFLNDAAFMRDFEELYAYYKHARLLQLEVRENKLLAAFQIGERVSDMRVFRWSIASSGEVSYVDARGERDLELPKPFDFVWVKAGRDLEVSGRFPHLNILDTLFVETLHGDLTLKVENNTESGQGIYSEAVEDSTQSIDDAQFEYARLGSLILLKVLPYREKAWRGLIYNTVTRKVVRNDAIVQACVQLPEDHGIIFPGGYYLQNGEHKAFDASMEGMQFKRAVRSPNGEDVLYLFYEPESGLSALFVYNMIQRALQNPIFAHGHAHLPDGRMVLFHDSSLEPTRVHQMQVWQTPFTSDEYAATRPPSSTFMGKLGNAELVRGISNLYDLAKEIENPDVSAQRYELLTHQTRRLFDLHGWFHDEQTGDLTTILHEITQTGENVLDEFEKVQSIRAQSDKAMTEARAEQRKILGRLNPDAWSRVQEYVDALNAITQQRGKLLTIREYRYMDVAAVDAMSAELQAAHTRVGEATGAFLAGEKALAPFNEQLGALDAAAGKAETVKALSEQVQAMTQMSGDLDMLSELMTTLKVDDATQRTRVVEAISGIYARLNQARARAEQKRKALGSSEAVAQFAAQFSLYSQSITSALALANTPEKADEQLGRLMVQLEELEGQFGEHEQFLTDIIAKREEMLETFEGHKQALLDERQRKAQAVMDAATRILSGLSKRTERFTTPEELNSFFAGDPLILKLRELAERLRDLKDAVKADDIEAQLKAIKDQAVRAQRDRSDLFEDGGNTIRMGPRHRFSVNTQPLDLTILPRGDELAVHLTGTDFMQPLNHPVLNELKPYWQVTLDSESPQLYRAEYLAGEVLRAAQESREGLDMPTLTQLSSNPETLTNKIREFAAPRYREGYERGIHDHDAALILQKLLPLLRVAGPLGHTPEARAHAVAWWAQHPERHDHWTQQFKNAYAMRELFGTGEALEAAIGELGVEMAGVPPLPASPTRGEEYSGPSPSLLVGEGRGGGATESTSRSQPSAAYLAAELEQGDEKLEFTKYAADLVAALEGRLRAAGVALPERGPEGGDAAAQWALLTHWFRALTATPEFAPLARFVPEAVALLLFGAQVPHQVRDVPLLARVEGLLGEHPRVQGGVLSFSVDDLLARLSAHRAAFAPAVQRYQAARQGVIAEERERLRLSEFQARPLTSFVRNKLINDIYLPIIGDNLAKQMGTVGENKRSDLMGLLMLISPPGYGKTTLMEYVANRLGLVFMKINGPSLGHEVRSLDPAQAPDATSKQELEKLNLALEMGNNVMLYVDDIQHTHPEFLQKFISLTDGTRRIEGVWQGQTKTYDLRGRKFAVVMAGNPYTESGEVFKIPDMLANRADIYNLGDVLGGVEDAFLLSYIENSLTSNPVLAPLATRDLGDLYLLVDKAKGKDVSLNGLKHAYSPAEVNEIVSTLQKLMQVRDVLYRVNAQYIASAAQADQYRTEPPFKLQGSYRNMNKLAEKISPVMNDTELQGLIADHYLGESQLLTTGAEENLLKLAEIRGTLTPEQAQRWEQIKADFRRNKAMGGDETDAGQRMVAQLADIASGLQALGKVREQPATIGEALKTGLEPLLTDLSAQLQALQGPRSTEAAANAEALKTSLGLVAEMASNMQVANTVRETQPVHDPLPDALKATIAPLLTAIATSAQQQQHTNRAIQELTDVIRKRQRPPEVLHAERQNTGRQGPKADGEA